MELSIEGRLRNSDLLGRYNTIKERVISEYLRFWHIHAPHYTDHGSNHSKTIIMTLHEILSDEIIQSFNEYELFFLLVSVWLHDIGIMIQTNTEEEKDEIRRTHNLRSRDIIRSHFQSLLLEQERILTGDICWAHSKNADINELNDSVIIRHQEIGNKEIRQKFLGALLRLADALDLCCTRTSEVLHRTTELNPESQFYHAIQSRVSGLVLRNTQIIIDINFTEDSELPILKKYIVIPLSFELECLRGILIDNSVIITDVFPRFNRVSDIEPLPTPPHEDIELEVPETFPEKIELKIKFLTLSREGEIEEAEKILDEIIELDPNNALNWAVYGNFYSENLIDLDKSLKGYQKAVEIEPNNHIFNASLGHILGENFLDIDGSFKYLEEAYTLEPENEINALNYSEALIVVGRYDDAKEVLNIILKRIQVLRFFLFAKFFMLSIEIIENNSYEELRGKIQSYSTILLETHPFESEQVWTFNKFLHYLEKIEVDDAVYTLLEKISMALNPGSSIEEYQEYIDDVL